VVVCLFFLLMVELISFFIYSTMKVGDIAFCGISKHKILNILDLMHTRGYLEDRLLTTVQSGHKFLCMHQLV